MATPQIAGGGAEILQLERGSGGRAASHEGPGERGTCEGAVRAPALPRVTARSPRRGDGAGRCSEQTAKRAAERGGNKRGGDGCGPGGESRAALACVKLKKMGENQKRGKWLKSNFSAAPPPPAGRAGRQLPPLAAAALISWGFCTSGGLENDPAAAEAPPGPRVRGGRVAGARPCWGGEEGACC